MTYEVALVLTVDVDSRAVAAETAERSCTDSELEATTLLVLPARADGLGGLRFAQVKRCPTSFASPSLKQGLPMKLKTPRCPECGELAAGTHERGIEACAELHVEEDGVADWNGTTDYWEGSETVTDEQGSIGLLCPLFHTWFSEDEHAPPLPPPLKLRIVITVAGGVVQAVNVSAELGAVELVVKDYDVDGPDEPGQCVNAAGERCYLLDCPRGHDVALPTPLDDGTSPEVGHAPRE